jgi:hypothetical protein
MPRFLDPFRFPRIAVAGWMNQRPPRIMDYLRQENPALRAQLAGRRVRRNGHQRRRVAAQAKGQGGKLLAEAATLVTPKTWLV